ncbi:MAG: tRNA (adenosine(37)-N6)-dimethylallyltransferase MiaA [Clostridiales bacterium]|jgi:tRNA dimethylallyltransferase|nr:tRNA (adenosine(37)-N6)-dimethylallyltransferase MiaA [Clostridiales bacterium]
MYVISGPTASGKTAVAIELAKKCGGEIISADSMQVYKGMNIGTAKPSEAETEGIPHYMIDIINPDEQFSAAEFQTRAFDEIKKIRARGKIPIIAGGTGFYINAVLYGAVFSSNAKEEELRKYFEKLAQSNGAEFLHEKLRQVDPAYAATLHANNVKRVARALAYCEITCEKFSEYNAAQKIKRKNIFGAKNFILSMSRKILYERINARTIAMFEAGLVEEVRDLLAKGYNKRLATMQGIGYKETVQFINGEMSQAETVAAIQQATRHYAKRQETWFRNQMPEAIILSTEGKTPEELAEKILHREDI